MVPLVLDVLKWLAYKLYLVKYNLLIIISIVQRVCKEFQ